eukprot:CAMPEP_0202867264 /NCGR_PEP_ID=MMETSP1391-20130828/9052_1 /ASSEMBLY_ACC=CAM_ASM_000867 /TAXON_ID=1034604 /ORGANISM="Chlamydomonas leiostraca, Strain SAG 11-49" /LENGTH=126 /DNA_ID=CAMNT_0049547291 /DNA_START=112 /DNA_END=489 /DNA_ORIENTATION=-
MLTSKALVGRSSGLARPVPQLRSEHSSRKAVVTHAGRSALLVQARQAQSGNTATKRRLAGPPGLPPINDRGGGGGGGGDGWNWERTARNLAPNLAFLGLYFAVTSWGGDGWGSWFGGGDGAGGGGG